MTILITGSSRGIGAALATQLAEEGHRLILVSRSEKELMKVCEQCNSIANNEIAVPLIYDLSKILDEIDEFQMKLTKLTSTLDILVNNAGYLVRKPFAELSVMEARATFDVNYFVPAQLIKICLPYLKASESASIVNVTSMAAVQGSSKFPGLSAYSSSKGALATLSECLAEEFKEMNIRVNALAFGAVQTEMLETAFPGLKASTSASEMAQFFKWFVLEGSKRFNGKMLPVSVSTP
ncbi:SDR family NAD(P)-dependent oxidoreductase [Bacteroidota bacterium]